MTDPGSGSGAGPGAGRDRAAGLSASVGAGLERGTGPSVGPGAPVGPGAVAGRGAGPGAVRRRRRRRVWSAAAVLLVAATAGVVVATRSATGADPEPAAPARPPATAKVARTDLVDRVQVDGELGHGPATGVTGRRAGTITWLPEPGRQVGRGEALYAVDAVAVPLLFGTTPLYRELRDGVPAGPDVLVLEENLAALGHADSTPDDKFTAGTARALRKWEKAAGLGVDGVLAPGDVLVLPGAVRVHALTARLGAPGEADLMTVTGVERLVSVELVDSRRPYAVAGAKVDVVLPDRRTAPGKVRAVAEKADDKDGGTLLVTVALDDPAAAPESGRVRVVLFGERRDGVLAVPVQALVALAEGGYAVELVDGRRLVPVTLGLFAAGLVEVSGEGLAEGQEVVTTA
ncbi:hypothetical protein SUDANB95_02090 [Actinosynnema sp. ALI-1.44]